MRLCDIEGCGRQHYARGMCHLHYSREHRAGNLSPALSELERFWSKVDKSGECWLWTDHINRVNGYGKFTWAGIERRAHRASYELNVGPIPEGYHIDHLCRVRACVRPDHLEAVTPAENNRRSDSGSAVRARQTHCIHGHEFTPENTYVRKEGWRMCRACLREKDRRMARERKAS